MLTLGRCPSEPSTPQGARSLPPAKSDIIVTRDISRAVGEESKSNQHDAIRQGIKSPFRVHRVNERRCLATANCVAHAAQLQGLGGHEEERKR